MHRHDSQGTSSPNDPIKVDNSDQGGGQGETLEGGGGSPVVGSGSAFSNMWFFLLF